MISFSEHVLVQHDQFQAALSQVHMRLIGIHSAWALSHLLRSLWADSSVHFLTERLTGEVAHLQAELQRTQRVIAAYGEILDSCENARAGEKGIPWLFVIVVILTLIWLWFLLVHKPKAPAVRWLPIKTDTV